MRAHVYYFPKYRTPGYLAQIQKRVINLVLNLKLLYRFYWQRGVCVAKGGGVCNEGGHIWWRGCMAKGVWQKGGVWQRGSCMAKGGVCGEGACMVGRHAWQGGVHGRGYAWQGDICGRGVWRGASMAGEIATAVDGTHPTGMHSCLDEWWHHQRESLMTSSEGCPCVHMRELGFPD